jgi:hypothetical protein
MTRKCLKRNGGAERDRTADLLNAIYFQKPVFLFRILLSLYRLYLYHAIVGEGISSPFPVPVFPYTYYTKTIQSGKGGADSDFPVSILILFHEHILRIFYFDSQESILSFLYLKETDY